MFITARKFLFGIAVVLAVVAFGPGAQVKADSVLPSATDTRGPGNLPSPARGPVVIPNSFIVQVEPGADPRGIANAVARATGGTVRYVYSHALSGFSLQVPPGIAIADIMGADPSVLKVEPNLMAHMYKKCATPPCNGGGGGGGGGGGVLTANDDTATTDMNTAVVITVLDNDSGKRLRILNADSPTLQAGTAVVSGDARSITYTPAVDYFGADGFGYEVVDKDAKTTTATVTVTVIDTGLGNNAPQATNDGAYPVDEDMTLNVTAATGVLANDTDADGDPLTAVLVTDVANGSLTLNADGSFDYTPDADYNGADGFTYKANDGRTDSNTATVSIDVAAINDAPVADAQSLLTQLNTPLPVTLTASDAENDPLNYSVVIGPANGMLEGTAPDLTYTPDPGYAGADSFTFKAADDGLLDSNIATIDISVGGNAQVTDWGVLRTGAASPPGDIDCSTIKIAILDTGIDLDHPDLNVDVAMSQDFTGTGSPDDDNGHGSHVAGIAGAKDNAIGVVGVCPGASLIAYKVLNAEGSGTFDGIIAAIDQVTANAGVISVANMSFGGQGFLDALRVSIQGLVNSGVVVAVSAGNSSEDVYGPNGNFEATLTDEEIISCWFFGILCPDDFIPAAYPEAAAIAAMADWDGVAGGLEDPTYLNFEIIPGFLEFHQYGDTLAFFSNHNHHPDFDVSLFVDPSPGGAIDVAAPGVNIFSTYGDGGYAYITGTSMASPHYAGAVARYIARNGRDVDGTAGIDGEDVKAIRQAMIGSAESQFDWRSTPPPESFIAGIEDNCGPNRPDTEDIDCNFEPLVDVGAIDP